MRKFSADVVFPITGPPIHEGVLEVNADGRILNIGRRSDFSVHEIEIFKGALCPGFVNVHCHLELSYLKNKLPERAGLAKFIEGIETAKKKFSDAQIQSAAFNADAQMLENGIVAVGDISNTDVSIPCKSNSKIKYHTFVELYGFNSSRAKELIEVGKNLARVLASKNLAHSISPHAPYSVSTELMQLINQEIKKDSEILSIHHLENKDELEMFFHGRGKIIERLKLFGINTSAWKVPGTRPLNWFLPFLKKAKKILLVHNTFINSEDVKTIKESDQEIFLCLCANANLYIENQLPDVNLILESNLPVCLGTDSLASNHSLSILDEIKTLSKHFPHLSFDKLLEWSSFNGAKFLQMDAQLGSFELGKSPGINLIEGPWDSDLSDDSVRVRKII